MSCSSIKSGVPRPVTYATQSQPNVEKKQSKSRRTNRIPSSDGVESIGAAARVIARCDVVEATPCVAVQPGIEEAKRLLPIRN